MMKLRSLWIVTAMAALVAVFAAAASADTGPTDIGKALALSIAPAQGTLAPGQSAWYSFVVPQEYSVVQMKRDERNGVNITPQTLTLQFSNSSNPDTAHNTGFHVYDPQGAHWVMNGIIPPSTLNAEGKPVAQPAWFGEGSPTPSGSLPDGLSMSSGGQISGTPTRMGMAQFQVQVTDAQNNHQSASLSINVIQRMALMITVPSTISLRYNQAAQVQLTASGDDAGCPARPAGSTSGR